MLHGLQETNRIFRFCRFVVIASHGLHYGFDTKAKKRERSREGSLGKAFNTNLALSLHHRRLLME
jgi:hypothetical protein